MPEIKQPIIHTIHLVRHGQCIGNVNRLSLEPEVNLITEFGEQQADALGDYLKHVEFTTAYASTYQRAYETAKHILAKSLKPCDLQIVADIRERETKGMQGMTTDEIDSMVMGGKLKGIRASELEIPDCENQEVFTARIRKFFTELFESLKECKEAEMILIVSHGLTMQRFLFGIEENGFLSDLVSTPEFKLTSDKMDQRIHNTADTTFTFTYTEGEDKPVIKFLQVHNTDHLTGHLKPY